MGRGAGLYREAEEFLAEGEQCQRDADERISEPELLRLRGRLLLVDGQQAAARSIYGWFTEGFEFPDLVSAKAVLDAAVA